MGPSRGDGLRGLRGWRCWTDRWRTVAKEPEQVVPVHIRDHPPGTVFSVEPNLSFKTLQATGGTVKKANRPLSRRQRQVAHTVQPDGVGDSPIVLPPSNRLHRYPGRRHRGPHKALQTVGSQGEPAGQPGTQPAPAGQCGRQVQGEPDRRQHGPLPELVGPGAEDRSAVGTRRGCPGIESGGSGNHAPEHHMVLIVQIRVITPSSHGPPRCQRDGGPRLLFRHRHCRRP